MSRKKNGVTSPPLSPEAARLLATTQFRNELSAAGRVLYLRGRVRDRQQDLVQHLGVSTTSVYRAQKAIADGREIGRPGRPPHVPLEMKELIYKTLEDKLENGESFDTDDVLKLV